MIKLKNKKGFTIVELIVVMAIIGVLVLLAMPKFMGQTQKARLTRIMANTTELEKASERYYLDHQEWPRLGDVPYTAEQLEEYSSEILNRTGRKIELDPNGNYYNIDYDKIQKYIQKPKDEFQYIIQNPVGEVFYMDGLTPKGIEKIELLQKDSIKVIFSGLPDEAFDMNINTKVAVTSSNKVTWTGNLDNKAINVVVSGSGEGNYNYMYVHFKDINDNTLNFIDLTNEKYISSTSSNNGTFTYKLIVPKGASYITFSKSSYYSPFVNDIYIDEEDLVNPSSVSNITSSSTDSKIVLNWEQNNADYSKSAIFRNGEFLKIVSGFTYEDKPLHANTEYTYEIQAIDTTGNTSDRVVYKEKTTEAPIVFSGIAAGAFDKDVNTKVAVTSSNKVTWTGDLNNKAINIVVSGSGEGNYNYMYVYFKDVNNNTLKFIDLNNKKYLSSTSSNNGTFTYKLIVPEGSSYITFDKSSYYSPFVNDIYVEGDLENPSEVSNITSISNDTSITLNWEQTDADYNQVAIFRDGAFLGLASGFSYTDKPLYSAQEYTYEIQAIDTNGNASKRITYKTSTTTPAIIFRGIAPEAFDKNSTTKIAVTTTDKVTWTGDLIGKTLNVTLSGSGEGNYNYMYMYFKDASGNNLSFLNLNNNQEVTSIACNNGTFNFRLVVPEGANYIAFGKSSYYSPFVNDIYVE